jgi:predicted metalloprotease with PDZ domain
MSEAVRYRVSMTRPHSHLFEVEALFPGVPGTLRAFLPVWTPGSYLVREYARHLQEVRAQVDGREVPVSRPDKRTFEVASNGAPVRFTYRVYANELTVRTSHLDGSHGYFNGACLFLYTEGSRWAPHRVRVDAPQGWSTFVALPREGDEIIAQDFDELVDSPFEVGPHTSLSFTAAGVPHEVVLWGGGPYPEAAKLTESLKRICEAEAQLFGGLPMQRYLFLVYLTDKGRGGLEHKASTALLFPRFGFNTPRGFEDFLTLASHEYFHLWNVKRIKPRALVPFDYGQESYTQLLWAFEGITSYYDNLLVRRAGLMPPGRYLQRLGESFTSLMGTPGRKVQPLSESSLTAWIKYYRQDENSPNSAISYYLKGELVSLLLDLTLRVTTQGRRSLDDVMRLLWSRYGDERGVPEDGVEAAAQEVAGADLSDFFNRAIRGTGELDPTVLSSVGLELRSRVRESLADKGGSPARVKATEQKPKGWMGLTLKGGGTVATVLEGSPAMEAGLYADDELVALDGFRVDGPNLLSRCEDKRPEEKVRVTVFRRDRLIELELKLGQKPQDAYYLARVENPSAEQKAAYTAWTGAAWDEA